MSKNTGLCRLQTEYTGDTPGVNLNHYRRQGKSVVRDMTLVVFHILCHTRQ